MCDTRSPFVCFAVHFRSQRPILEQKSTDRESVWGEEREDWRLDTSFCRA